MRQDWWPLGTINSLVRYNQGYKIIVGIFKNILNIVSYETNKKEGIIINY